MSSGGDVVVNSLCSDHCNLGGFRGLVKESPDDARKITIEEAPLCDDTSTNYCHRYAKCVVEDVHLKCVCKPGTNDTSSGLGKTCEGVPADDDCIMILGACLIFWLIILLGLLLLIPLIIFLLSHCCPGRGNLIHPRKEGLHRHGKRNGTASSQENKHIAAIMSTLLAKNAGGTREMAMKMALAELKKKEKEKAVIVPQKPKAIKVVDAHEVTSSTVINNSPANSVHQAGNGLNGSPLVMKEISSIPGTVPYGETPILEKISPPDIAVKPATPEIPAALSERNPLAQKTVSQQSFTVADSQKDTY
ncbi:hypothetical protein ANCCAN_00270 [Ancylostoma caninum]|uniref:Uncharacterized protein n=1 Tax=Ancylostoma caninum TaxID=29170 RepID=A0A368HB57_ANCCA|nr:hypothetical protein ANCCAN_00270 [Ancylostoma caninum]